MPQNVVPTDVQWACDAGAAVCPNDDLFRVRISKPHVEVLAYVDNSDEPRAMVSTADGTDGLMLIDPFTGQQVTANGDALPSVGTTRSAQARPSTRGAT